MCIFLSIEHHLPAFGTVTSFHCNAVRVIVLRAPRAMLWGGREVYLLRAETTPVLLCCVFFFSPQRFTCQSNFSYVRKLLLRLWDKIECVGSFFLFFFFKAPLQFPLPLHPFLELSLRWLLFLWTLLESVPAASRQGRFTRSLRGESSGMEMLSDESRVLRAGH